MDHSEAVELMATERYLLGELPAEQREAFEAHFFECYECALDVRAEAAFLKEAKAQLPQMTRSVPDMRGGVARVCKDGNEEAGLVWLDAAGVGGAGFRSAAGGDRISEPGDDSRAAVSARRAAHGSLVHAACGNASRSAYCGNGGSQNRRRAADRCAE